MAAAPPPPVSAPAASPEPTLVAAASLVELGPEEKRVTSGTTGGEVDEPYTIYTNRERWALVSVVAVAGLFSPLPANIFFPSITILANDFAVSVGTMNLSVTVYLALQGVAPMIWGPTSDRFGRRPAFLLCLVVLTLSCVGLALTPTSAFWLLLLLRCVQAAGCAPMIALGAGVIGDISESWDRGSKFGVFNLGPMLAPNIGPVIGGVLAENLGWRSVFWFLTIGSAVCFIFILCLLPETLRALVGNGSIQQRPLLRPFFPILGRGRRSPTTRDPSTPRPTPPFPNPFLLFQYPDLCLVLAFTGVVYAVNYSITATISSSFQELYPYLSETDTGLVYLSTGGGMIVGSTVTGRLLDWDFGRVKRRFAEEKERRGETVEGDLARDLSFPIEEARLRMMPAHLVVFIASTIGWGWSLTSGTSIAVPLVLQIILGWTSMAILNTSMTLGLDLLPKQSSSVTACVNLVRCSLAAILVSVIDKATNRLGFGVTYTILSAVCVLLLPLMYLEMRVGERFRRKRAARHVE